MLLDKFDEIGTSLSNAIAAHADEASGLIEAIIQHQYGSAAATLPGLAKLARNAATILAGLFVGSTVNPLLLAHARPRHGRNSRASL
jgi:DNA (cytosine-5)-methyltransferase 1